MPTIADAKRRTLSFIECDYGGSQLPSDNVTFGAGLLVWRRPSRSPAAQEPDRVGPGRSAFQCEKRLARLLVMLAQVGHEAMRIGDAEILYRS